ncbi:MAG: cobyric acid synthase CobQ, partial [Nitrospirae bacterium]
LKRAVRKGIPVVGVCGGYQMMGAVIRDPQLIEGSEREVRGLGLLDIETCFEEPKITCQVRARVKKGNFPFSTGGDELRGYEIHMGRSEGDIGLFDIRRIPQGEGVSDGAMKGNCWGTYIHGIFDNDPLRWSIINQLRIKKGLREAKNLINYHKYRDEAIDRFTDRIIEHLNVDYILKSIFQPV